MSTDKDRVSDFQVSRLSEFLSRNIGLHFPEKRREELVRKISTTMRDFGFQNLGEFIDWLLSSPPTRQQIEVLASHLTVNETYFFREYQTFDSLKKVVLPGLIAERRKREKTIRVWSAGCSTGEEAYSVAVLLKELIPDINDWGITILATDIDPHVLEKARKGLYSEWSFRETPPHFRERYFRKTGSGAYAVDPGILNMVVFSYLNLSEDSYPSLSNNTNAMDLILCRNVLMYFAPEYIKDVARRFHMCLTEGGHLVVSVVEVSNIFAAGFQPFRLGNTTFYRKTGDGYSGSGKKTAQPVVPAEEKSYSSVIMRKTNPPKRPGMSPIGQTRAMKHARLELTPYEQASDLFRRGIYDEAEEKLAPLMLLDGTDPQPVILFARVLANQGRLSDALRCCEKAISIDKSNPELYYLRATILHEQGETAEAVVSLNKAIYLDPDFVMAHFTLGNLAMSGGRDKEKNRYFRNTARLLSKYRSEDILPEADGMTAGRLSEILCSMGH